MSKDIQFDKKKQVGRHFISSNDLFFCKRKSFQVVENINTKIKVSFINKFALANKMKNESYQQSIWPIKFHSD